MVRKDDLEACRSLLILYNGQANGRPAGEIFSDIMACSLIDSDLVPIIIALRELNEAKADVDLAYERKTKAEIHLAELVGVKRRDKDTGFDAECEAENMIVNASIEGLPRPSWRKV